MLAGYLLACVGMGMFALLVRPVTNGIKSWDAAYKDVGVFVTAALCLDVICLLAALLEASAHVRATTPLGLLRRTVVVLNGLGTAFALFVAITSPGERKASMILLAVCAAGSGILPTLIFLMLKRAQPRSEKPPARNEPSARP